MSDTKERSEHESYGLIGCSRITGSSRNLFGSSISHSNTVRLQINTAAIDRYLSKNWYHRKKTLIEVEMSQTQFAEMITSMNIGDGVPCTLRSINKVRLDDPPNINQRQQFEKEFDDDVNKIKVLYQTKYNEVQKLLHKKGQLKVTEKKIINDFLFELTRIIDDNIPFIQKSFNKAMDKTVHEAKGEVEAFVMNKVTSLGIKEFQKEMIRLGEGDGSTTI